MEPENEPLEEEIPIFKPSFSGSMLVFGGVFFLPRQERRNLKVNHFEMVDHLPNLHFWGSMLVLRGVYAH